MKTVDPDELATGVIRVDSDGHLAWMNRSAADLLGPSGSGRTHAVIDAVSPALGEWTRRVSQTGRSLRVPEALIEVTGQRVDASFQLDGTDVLIELHTVTERVRQREITERADRQQAVALLSRRLAHELRNPLAGVRGGAQLIATHADDATTRRHAGMIQREVDRITALIEHFTEDGEKRVAAVNLHRVLDEAAELVLAESHDRVEVDKDFDTSIPELEADGGQLHQLFLNLMRNSAQAGAGRIRLVTRIEHQSPLLEEPNRHAVRIDIDDDGSGVSESLHDRLFLPLVSGRDQGSGFGLAIVQQIARAHRGLVEYLPLDPGSRFRVRLPLIPAGETIEE